MKTRTPSRFYSLALFTTVQGKTVRLCTIEAPFSSTRKREAQTRANWHNRQRGWEPGDDKYVNIEPSTTRKP